MTCADPDRRGPYTKFSGKLHGDDAPRRHPTWKRHGELVVAFLSQWGVRGSVAAACAGPLVHLVVHRAEAADYESRQSDDPVSNELRLA